MLCLWTRSSNEASTCWFAALIIIEQSWVSWASLTNGSAIRLLQSTCCCCYCWELIFRSADSWRPSEIIVTISLRPQCVPSAVSICSCCSMVDCLETHPPLPPRWNLFDRVTETSFVVVPYAFFPFFLSDAPNVMSVDERRAATSFVVSLRSLIKYFGPNFVPWERLLWEGGNRWMDDRTDHLWAWETTVDRINVA